MRKFKIDSTPVIGAGIRLSMLRQFIKEIEQLRIENTQLEIELGKVIDEQTNIGVLVWNALDAILQDRQAFFEPGTTTYRLKDGVFSKEVTIDPRDLVCVFTNGKGRKKAFILREDYTSPDGTTREFFKRYEVNNNDITFGDIKNKVDPMSFRLVQIAENIIVNVGYYEYADRDLLVLQKNLPNNEEFKQFRVIRSSSKELFELQRRNWQENYSLQKRINHYRNLETKFGRP